MRPNQDAHGTGKGFGCPDILIIGGGAVGVATAYELISRKASVTLLERGERLASGCSYGNTGLIRTSHTTPLSNPAVVGQALRWSLSQRSPFYLHPRPAVLPWLVRFLAASGNSAVETGTATLRSLSLIGLRLHAEYARSGIDTGFLANGIVDLFATEKAFQSGIKESDLHAAAGQVSEILDLAQVRQMAPTLNGYVAGGIFYPGDAHCDPFSFVTNVGKAALRLGATVRTKSSVIRLERQGHRVTTVHTSNGAFHPGTVVVATGIWSAKLCREIGVFLPLEAAKGYHVDFHPSAGDPLVPVFIKEARVIATPLSRGLRFGGTLELDGLNDRINPIRIDAIKGVARGTFAHIDSVSVSEVWAGLRPCTPDSLPIIGRAPGLDNLIIAAGHGMSGIQLSTVTGRLVADLVFQNLPIHDLQPLRADRFRPLFGRF